MYSQNVNEPIRLIENIMIVGIKDFDIERNNCVYI
jgi:hypothetical protein